MEITAEAHPIKKFEDYFFLVPDYQREYVWETDDQVEQFVMDIDYEFNPKSPLESSYFLGSMIVVKKGPNFHVIDGQQRLTTIIITLCAFRDVIGAYQKTNELPENGQEYVDIVQGLLYKFDISSNEHRMRLELQYDDSKDFLKDLIISSKIGKPETDSIEKMAGAYQRLVSYMEGHLKKSVDQMFSFIRYFISGIDLVIIESVNLSSALKIFETINQRGVGLDAMDLVKNLIFSEANEGQFDTIKKTWKEITKCLENCAETNPLRFLKYFLIGRYHNGMIREDDLYKWIISVAGKEAIGYSEKPVKFVKELHKGAIRYAALVESTEALIGATKYPCVTNIGFINKYKSRMHLILLMALSDTFDDDDVDYFASQIESFLFYSLIASIEAKYYENKFANWASEIRTFKTRDDIKTFVVENLQKWVEDNYSKIHAQFISKQDWSLSPLYRTRFILGKIDNYVRLQCGLPKNGLDFYDQLEVEHIMPQTPKDWKIPESFEDEVEYTNEVHKLGNITLVEGLINKSLNKVNDLSSNWYSLKCSEYEKSDVIITNLQSMSYSIGSDTALNRFRAESNYSFPEWGVLNIASRQELLFNLALKCWTFNGQVAKKTIHPEGSIEVED